MIGYLGLSVANSVLNHLLKDATPYSLPSSYYVGLFLASTGLRTSASGSWVEVTGSGYSRVEIRGSTGRSFSTSAVGVSRNSETWNWPIAVEAWGSITHLAILDAATSGNVVIYGEFDDPVAVNEDDLFRFVADDLEVTL